MSGPLRVGVNLTWLVPGVVGGSEQSTTRSLRGLAALADETGVGVELFALASFVDAHPDLADRFEVHVAPVGGRNKALRVGAEFAWLGPRVRHLDVVHHAGGTVPGWSPIPIVLTIHDIQPLDHPEHFHPVKVAYLRRALPRSVRRAAEIVVPSRFVADRVVDRLGADPALVRVVPHPGPDVADVTPNEEVRARYGIAGPYLVLPAITYPHKRHEFAIEVVAALDDVTLVLTGGPGPSDADVDARISELGVGARVRRLGRVPAADLHGLLTGSAGLLFPSVYEGFGLPALEAMALGCPVVVADAGALPEVVGDAGVVVPPDDHAAWVAALREVLESAPSTAAGVVRAGRFTPEATARGLVAAYRSAAEGR